MSPNHIDPDFVLGSSVHYYPSLGEVFKGSSSALVTSYLLCQPYLGREELSKALGLSVAEVSIVCRHLSKDGILVKSKAVESIPWCVFSVDRTALAKKMAEHKNNQQRRSSKDFYPSKANN